MTVQPSLFGDATAMTVVVSQPYTDRFAEGYKRTSEGIVIMATVATEVRDKYGYRPYIAWLNERFGLKPRMGDNLLAVHKNLLTAKFAVDTDWRAFTPSALYLLAAPSTPESARQEAIDRAEAGETITHQTARDIVDQHEHDDDDDPLTPYEQGIADMYERQIAEAEYESEPEPREAQRQQQTQVITGSSKSNEWYTPAHIIELAREVLGSIDLDPASSPEANETVKATSYCTAQEDGYSQPWGGKDDPITVWLNPPYGKEEGERETNAMRWSRKLIIEHDAGHVKAAILLVKAALGYEWFEQLWYDYPTCLLRKRLSFVRPDGSDDGEAKHATALIYLGEDIDRFRSAFRSIGRVILPEE
jgi:hypothetical protein